MPSTRKRLSIGDLCEDSDNNVEFKAVPIEKLLNPHSSGAHTKKKRIRRPTFLELVEAFNKARDAADNATGPLLEPIKIHIPGYEDRRAIDHPSLSIDDTAQEQSPKSTPPMQARLYPSQLHPTYPYTNGVSTSESCASQTFSRAPTPSKPIMRRGVVALQHRNSFPPHNLQTSYQDSTTFRPLAFPHQRFYPYLQMNNFLPERLHTNDQSRPGATKTNETYFSRGLTNYTLDSTLQIYTPEPLSEQHMYRKTISQFADTPNQSQYGFNTSFRPHGHGF